MVASWSVYGRRGSTAVPPLMVAAPILVPAPVPAPASPGSGRHYNEIHASRRELQELRLQLTVPVAGITRFDLRDSYAAKRGERMHHAIDIPAPRGSSVLAAADSRLLKLFTSKAGGLMIYTTDESKRFILYYAHLDGYAKGLQPGMRLARGQVIGYVGTTGNAPPNTPHLHFGIMRGTPDASWSRGTAVNPYPLLFPGNSP